MGQYISREQSRAFYEPYRAAFEAGDPIESIVVACRRDRASIYAAARKLGWDTSRRRNAGPQSKVRTRRVLNMDQLRAEQRTCVACGETKAATRFVVSRRVRSKCRTCMKAAARRRKGCLTRDQITIRSAKIRAELEARARERTPTLLLRQLRSLLGRLFEQRCAEAGENPCTITFRARYRLDEAFRIKQIARRWAQKEARGERGVVGDGTLDSATIQRLYAEATACPYCGVPLHHLSAKSLDHIIPLSRGGLHSIHNVLVCCRPCNMDKRDRTPEKWRRVNEVKRNSTRAA